MEEVHTPAEYAVGESDTCLTALLGSAAARPYGVIFTRPQNFEWVNVTAAEFIAEVYEVAKGFIANGVQQGDRIALLSETRYEWSLLDFAIWAAGAVSVPIYGSSSLSQIEWIIEDSGAVFAVTETREHTELMKNLVLGEDGKPLLHGSTSQLRRILEINASAIATLKFEGRPIDDDQVDGRIHATKSRDLASLVYTSGTTGLPKGVMLTHRNLESNGRMGEAWIKPSDNESIYSVLPLFHAYGMTLGVTIAALCRARLVLFPTVDMGLITKAMKKTRPTILPAVPPVYRRLMDVAKEQGISLQGVRYAVSGAMNLPPELVAEWEDASGGDMVEGYGLTECAPLVSCNPLNDTRRAGSIGIPFPSTDIRVVDPETLQDVPLGEEGELWVHGPQCFAGYWKREEDTQKTITADGWLRTGDIVRLDEDYFIQIVDRIKEVIITGGFNVSPTEVETALKQHDSVADAAVVGIPQASGGEMVVAAVIPAEGHAVDEHALREHCYARVTRYKVPRKIVAVDDLPRSMLGKILRRKVREQLIASGELD